jgi:hypothetical protein
MRSLPGAFLGNNLYPFVSGKRVKDTHYLYYDLGYSVVDWKDFDKKTIVLNDETERRR